MRCGRDRRLVRREARRRVLLREGDGEVVHENDGVAAAGWGEAESLKEEGSGEEMLIFGFVEVAECFCFPPGISQMSNTTQCPFMCKSMQKGDNSPSSDPPISSLVNH